MKSPVQMFAASQQRRSTGAKLKLLAATLSGVFLAAAFGPVEAANKSKVSVYQHGKPVGTLPCESNPGSLPRSNPLFSRTAVLISFLGRTIVENKADSSVAQAIGVDQETALLLECEDMSCSTPPAIKAVSNPKSFGAAYILKPSANSSLTVEPATPLTFTNVEVKKFQANSAPTTYKINVNNGVMTSTNANGSVY
ncbi:hypothetical protein [Ferribacterium limneticum]|uniref:hypothetical protein n=1 Tax=Ferribacterium limneticum TaxID=76259 RepID=UPI001CFBEC92|nr:hypothetical protein [Ferribacterium limneticum]UCV17516.1 hypothetical protein KI610_11825 [Ferribacterium limneticum]